MSTFENINFSGDRTQAAFEETLDALLDDHTDPAQFAALAETLNSDPGLVEAYVDQVRMHAMLQWRHGMVRPSAQIQSLLPTSPLAVPSVNDSEALTHTAGLRHPRRARRWIMTIAASIAVVAAATALVRQNGLWPFSNAPLGEVLAVADIVWADGQMPLYSGDPIYRGQFVLKTGTLRLQLTSDALVTVTGPASFELFSDMRMRAQEGRITARVGPRGKGFTVESPSADVIDLGTEFGVQVSSNGKTDVVVFEGQVDLLRKQQPDNQNANRTTRMNKGEGLQVDLWGVVTRIVSIEGHPSNGDWDVEWGDGAKHNGSTHQDDRTIASVHDNLRDPASHKYYRIVRRGLQDDVQAYVDRSYEWNAVDAQGLPEELRNADLVMTFNSDKRTPDLQLTVTLARPAALYVFMSDDALPPEWLNNTFTPTDLRIGLDEGPPDMPRLNLQKGSDRSVDRVFRVWRRDVPEAGSVTLGDNAQVKSMYGIAAVPLP